ncbi:glycine zipper domain-containing protein [Roseateles sp.]|uniref:glycine zipper domain-containing protein n=1 Tax=Roseateles sp. TaxID=1971397 RepID=UPI0025EA1C6A|nr:glycine zipper domain-containing protein [Roseateles sp.]MBV8037522.1 glycine zipper 2TM domain-containing protein [Roseateles sp.]
MSHFALTSSPGASRGRLVLLSAAAAASLTLGGCAGMSAREASTIVGATAGAVVGGAVTGTTAGAAVGAAAGGVIGNEVSKRRGR